MMWTMQLLQLFTLKESQGGKLGWGWQVLCTKMRPRVQGERDSSLLSHGAVEGRTVQGGSLVEFWVFCACEEAAWGQRKQKKRKSLEGLERKMPCDHPGPRVAPDSFSRARKSDNSQVTGKSSQKILPRE